LDTVSLVKLCQLELGVRRAVEWLIDDFHVCLPDKVFEEGRLQLASADDQSFYFGTIQPRVIYDRNENYDSVFGRHVDRLPGGEKSNLDEGETRAASIALELSRVHNQYVVLVTDDHKAALSLQNILRDDQVGLIKNSYELLLFLASRHPEELPMGELDAALRQLNWLLRNNDLPAAIEQKPDELLLEYLGVLQENRLSIRLPGNRGEE
jgi:hypothetical protein